MSIWIKVFPQFRHLTNQDGNTIIFDVRTGALIELPDPVVSILEIATLTQNPWNEVLSKHQSNKVSIDEIYELISNLIGDGFISDAVHGDESKVELIHSGIVLDVTPHCQLDCQYCLASGGDYNDPLLKDNMTFDVARGAIDFFFTIACPSINDYLVYFYGGEPLMNWEVIQQTIEYAEHVAKKKGKGISFTTTTNGLLLSDDIAKYASQHNLSFQVSLDGDKCLHNTLRPAKDQRVSSYDGAKKAIQRARSHQPRVAGHAAVTSLEYDYSKIADMILTAGATDVFTSVVFYPEGDKGLALSNEELRKYVASYRERLFDRSYYDNARENYIQRINSRMGYDYCGCGDAVLGVDPIGRVYTCHRVISDTHFQIGDIYEGIDVKRARQLKETTLTRNRIGCRSCWAQLLCGGSCYAENLYYTSAENVPSGINCYTAINIIESSLEYYLLLARDNRQNINTHI